MKNRLPPGPRTRVPGDHLLAFHRDPLGFLERLARDYGDLVHFRVGMHHAFLVVHPDLIQTLWVTHSRDLRIGVAQRQASLLLGEGLITSEGEFHTRQRRLIQPAFHRRNINDLTRISAEYTADWCERWREGEVLDLSDEFWYLTLNITAKSIFSTTVQDEMTRLNNSMTRASKLASPAVFYFADFLLKLPLPIKGRVERAKQDFDATIYRIIREHREQGAHSDVMDMLLHATDEQGRMSDTQLRDEVITLLTSAHGTTAIALMWVFYLLSQNPEVETKFFAEIDRVLGGELPTADALRELPYTRRILAEAMRLYPPAWAMDRQLENDIEVGDYFLPKGSILIVSQYVTQRDARFFPDPARFDPDRFLPEHEEERPRLSYLPFGAGPRICIGEDLARTNGMLLMATIAQRWRLRLEPGHRVELLPRSGLASKDGMRMVMQRRPPSGAMN